MTRFEAYIGKIIFRMGKILAGFRSDFLEFAAFESFYTGYFSMHMCRSDRSGDQLLVNSRWRQLESMEEVKDKAKRGHQSFSL